METITQADKVVASIMQQGVLFSFMILVILSLVYVVKTLYHRNIIQGESNSKALVDSTIAINNNTMVQEALTKQIERLNDRV